MAYVYRHIRLDKNEPFYIGIGNSYGIYSRAYQKCKRNKIWQSIVSKTKYEVEIIIDNISREEACISEMYFIKLYGRVNNDTGILANMSDGGDGGNIGLIHSESTKNKMSESRKGDKNSFYGKTHTKDSIGKIAKYGEEHWAYGKRGVECHNYGRKHSENTKVKMSEDRSGYKNSFYGKEHSLETKQKLQSLQKCKSVIQIDPYGNIISVYKSLHESERSTGFNRVSIKDAGTFKRLYKGYFWKLENNITNAN